MTPKRTFLWLFGAVALALACGETWARASPSASAPSARPPTASAGPRDPRGSPWKRERNARGLRIVVLGDDSAYGSTLPEEHTWPRLLELEFARDGLASNVEVLDVAERESDASRAVDLLRDFALDLQPTMLVVSLGALDARRPFEIGGQHTGLERSALWRRVLGAPGNALQAPRLRESVTRSEFHDLRERAVFDFGVRLAQMIELARARRVAIVLLRPPFGGRSPTDVARRLGTEPSLGGDEAAELLHAALLDELDRIAEITQTSCIDAVALAEAHPEFLTAPGRWTAPGCAALAARLHTELRPRLR